MLYYLRVTQEPYKALNWFNKLKNSSFYKNLEFLLNQDKIFSKDSIVLGVGFEAKNNH